MSKEKNKGGKEIRKPKAAKAAKAPATSSFGKAVTADKPLLGKHKS